MAPFLEALGLRRAQAACIPAVRLPAVGCMLPGLPAPANLQLCEDPRGREVSSPPRLIHQGAEVVVCVCVCVCGGGGG